MQHLLRPILLSLFVVLGSPLAALTLCDDLWFTRNLVFDRAGYCFGSPLGQAVFDNADCTTSAPDLSKRDKAFIDRVRKVEADWSCQINTSRITIEVDDIQQRRAIRDLPIADGYESACIGWRGQRYLLFSERNTTTEPIGELLPGDTIGWFFAEEGAWGFLIISNEGITRTTGWAKDIELNEESCDFAAG